jgi:hypothetical protein
MKKIVTQSALALLLAAAGAITAASAAPTLYESGPYHQEVLPDGTVTGPIGPETNGG